MFDTSLAKFSPDGRLLQVERALQSSTQGSSLTFSTHEDHILVCIELREISKVHLTLPKIHQITKSDAKSADETNIYLSFSGLLPDSYLAIDQARIMAIRYRQQHDEQIPIDILARQLCRLKQKCTVSNSLRPFGIRTVLFGFLKINDGLVPKVYVIEPDGNYSEYLKGSIGMRGDEMNKSLENGGDAIDGIFEVVQNDVEKVNSYKIYLTNIESIDKNSIKMKLDQLYDKQHANDKK